MGEVASVIKALSCDACAKYVCNSMQIHSKCRDCCELDLSTQEIEIPDDDSIYSVEVENCCQVRKA